MASAVSAMAMQTWINIDTKLMPHSSLNVSRVVICCRNFRDCSDEEIRDALRSQGVTTVKYVNAKKNGVFGPSCTVILTVNKPIAPCFVKAAC
jgi:hypothetical protein